MPTLLTHFFACIYWLLWLPLPLVLLISKRLREGWFQRLVPRQLSGPVDIWIHAASGGEAYLALELIHHLPRTKKLSVLITTNTSQGLDILNTLQPPENLRLDITYAPFDHPLSVVLAFSRWNPKLLAILETEIWPGWLLFSQWKNIPRIIVNGRMTERSVKRYSLVKWLFCSMAPDRILAASREYQERFENIFGPARVSLMANIKFDRLMSNLQFNPEKKKFSFLDPQTTSFLVLGSVRKEEEKLLIPCLSTLFAEIPQLIVGLFPRHMHRIEAWKYLLDQKNIPWILRSEATQPVSPGNVILWDVFGELNHGYSLAHAVFVGGSLAPCGGQNFLEPLTCGISPCIGPYWENFAWVGKEIVEQKLVHEVANSKELTSCLARQIKTPVGRKTIQSKTREYIEHRCGGAQKAAKTMLDFLHHADYGAGVERPRNT